MYVCKQGYLDAKKDIKYYLAYRKLQNKIYSS